MIIAAGLVTVMLLAAARRRRAARMTVGDFVLVNSYLVQLYAPLERARHGLPQHQAVADRSRIDVPPAERARRDRGPARRAAAGGAAAARSSSTTSPSATIPRRAILHDVSLPRAGRAARWPSSGRAAPANPPSRACCSASTTSMPAPSASTARICAMSTQHSLRARHRRRAAGYGAVQRHRALQHRLWPARRRRRRDRGGGAPCAHPRFRRGPARWLRSQGRRARPEALGRREAARRHRPRHAQEPAHPDLRRGDLGARHPAPSRRSRPISTRSRPAAPRW